MLGSISTDADFGYPPWNPPHKHHVDRDGYITVGSILVTESTNTGRKSLGLTMPELTDTGEVTLWLGHKRYPLSSATHGGTTYSWTDVDLDWAKDDEVRVALVYERRLPSAPKNVRVTAPPDEDGTLEVSWDEANDGTFPIECYLVEFRHPSGEAKKRKQSYPGSLGPGKGCGDSPPTSVRRTDLETGVQYQVLVQALSGDGFSEWSETKTGTIREPPPTCPENADDVWCGVITVEDAAGTYGYNSFYDQGELSDNDFDVGTNSYIILIISVAGERDKEDYGNLALQIDPRPNAEEKEELAELTLYLDNDAFKLSESRDGPSGFYYWVADLDWSSEGYILARLGDASSGNSQRREESSPALSVADAEATEGEDETLDFLVRLDGNPGSDVTVDYGTRDGTATAGSDYTETSGTLTFEPGEDEQTVSVPITDDDVEDDGETFTLVLSNASGAGVANDDYEAVGTIRNDETEAPSGGLTASFEDMPETHDGERAFRFRVAFSENIGISFRSLREDAFTVTGGRVTGGKRVDDRRDLFEMTVEPDSGGNVTITLQAGRECAVSGAICTKGENRRKLTNTPTAKVAGPLDDTPESLTARFVGMPEAHTGEGGFHFRVAFSEDIGISFRSLREDAFTVTGGRVTGGRRVDGRRDLFRMTVRPDSDGAVTISLPAGRECEVSGAICTKGENRRKLTNSPSATVASPVGIAVADARVEEGADAVLAFAVTLSRAASGTLTVDYATSDGTATAGEDYTATSGTLTFEAGESSKTIEVTVLDDAHDEGEETLTLRLSNPSGGRVTDGEATGTIENRDPLPKALLARFGRAAAVHVVEQVQERIEARRETGIEAQFAGRQLRPGMEREMAVEFLSRLAPSLGANRVGSGVPHPMSVSPVAGSGSLGTPGLGGEAPMGTADELLGGANPMGSMPGTDGGLNQRGHFGRGLGGGNLLTGSAFVMNHETRRGGILSFWSRGAQSRFAGRDGKLSLDGRVRTTMFGADYAKGPLITGLSLSHSRGLGGYSGVSAGEVTSSVTGLYPWLGYKVSDRITVWGVTGYGKGALTLTPGAGTALRSGLSMAMTAGGMRGELADSVVGGFGLAFKADALWVGTGIEGVDGPQGRLAATSAAVTRYRTALEASRDYRFQRGLSLQPSLEVGVRRDGGDAENGAGVDIGGGLIVSDALTGLSADVRVRMLLVHQDQGFRDRGMSVSFSYNPTPSTPLGFTAKLTPSWGGQATSGARALWGRETMAGMAQGGMASGNRLAAELGYGLPVGSWLVGTPRFGIGTSEYGRDYRLGYGLTVLQRGSMNFELGIEGTRRESSRQGVTDHGALARLTARW